MYVAEKKYIDTLHVLPPILVDDLADGLRTHHSHKQRARQKVIVLPDHSRDEVRPKLIVHVGGELQNQICPCSLAMAECVFSS